MSHSTVGMATGIPPGSPEVALCVQVDSDEGAKRSAKCSGTLPPLQTLPRAVTHAGTRRNSQEPRRAGRGRPRYSAYREGWVASPPIRQVFNRAAPLADWHPYRALEPGTVLYAVVIDCWVETSNPAAGVCQRSLALPVFTEPSDDEMRR
ncbi:unnamed protein product [Gadus morhua 'NCC']